MGDFAISGSFAAITPFILIIIATASLSGVGLPIAIAFGLFAVGCYFKYASNDGNMDKTIESISTSIITNLVLM